MKTISDFIKLSFYDTTLNEEVHIVEVDEIKKEIQKLIKEKGLKDKWIKEFFEL
jgi:hypothetical protein